VKVQSIIHLAVALSVLVLATCSKSNDSSLDAQQQPNIIYILADDLGYGDLSCYGQKHFKTPHIDQLAEEGMRFTQHYAGSTVCAPSRSSLLTGMHTGHTP
jgi:arylsulfatase A